MLRKLRGLNKAELAKLAGMQESNLCNVENHNKIATVSIIIKLAEALGVTPDLIVFLSVTASEVPDNVSMKYSHFSSTITIDYLRVFFSDEELVRSHLMENEFDHNH